MPISIYFVDQSGGIFVLCSLLFNSNGPSPNFQTAHFCDEPFVVFNFVVAAFRVNIHGSLNVFNNYSQSAMCSIT